MNLQRYHTNLDKAESPGSLRSKWMNRNKPNTHVKQAMSKST